MENESSPEKPWFFYEGIIILRDLMCILTSGKIISLK